MSVTGETGDLTGFLGGIDLFSSLETADLENLVAAAEQIELAADEYLFQFGSPDCSVFVIVQGEIIICRNQKIISRLGPGEYFGELALLDSGLRSAAARAGSGARLLELPAEKCRALFQAKPELQASISRTLAGRL
ncbi:MAG: cyclic nucleotide-binding domain-containing protein, partial [Myxococcota bacterium]